MALDTFRKLIQSATHLEIDPSSKIILFSDCHRGDNGWADDFAHNQNLYFHALTYYLQEGFTYVEVGDGDELWENSNFGEIRAAHSHVFHLMKQFHDNGRFYWIYGNHDIQRRDPAYVKETLTAYYDERSRQEKPLFPGIQLHESLLLRYAGTKKTTNMLVFHGHQADTMNSKWWKLSCYIVRNIWRPLQLIGVHDPTSPAKNFKKRERIETILEGWARTSGIAVIAGHTHRPRFPSENRPPFFNTGSCVHPRCITGIEIISGQIQLIKWVLWPNDKGLISVNKEIIDGPRQLGDL